jgi:1-acyl-sn-glycerol-3-phosphate acyltransferase
MSDFSYWAIRKIGMPIVHITSRPVVLHADRAARAGGYILASNHLSPYDVAGLMAVTPRALDFLSIVEMRDKPLVGTFFRKMNCMFLDRGRTDPAATREMVTRLAAGRVVAMFPEGNIRTMETSVVKGAPFKPGVVRLAQLAKAPIIPTVIIGTAVYSRFSSWYPFRAIRFGVAYGEPILVPDGDDERPIREAATATLKAAYLDLYRELCATPAGRGVPTT